MDFFIVFSDLGINTTMEQELNAIREIYLRSQSFPIRWKYKVKEVAKLIAQLYSISKMDNRCRWSRGICFCLAGWSCDTYRIWSVRDYSSGEPYGVEKKYAGRKKISVISHAAISARNIF